MSTTSNTPTTFDAVLAELAQPFDPEAVEFKAGAVTQDKARALALAYVDSRVYQARLDAVAPDWRNEYTREYAGDRVIVTCALTVAGVTRQAIGESLQASARARRQHRDRGERRDQRRGPGLQAGLLRVRPGPLPLLGPAGVGRVRRPAPAVHARGRAGLARDVAHGQVRAGGQSQRQPR